MSNDRNEGDALFQPAEIVLTRCRKVEEDVDHYFQMVNNNIQIPSEGRKPCYVVKHRLKSGSDIVSKVERKRKGAIKGSPDYFYEPKHVTDGLGYRYVTLFQNDILLVVEELIKMFKHASPYTHNPIQKTNGLKEAVIYTNRPKNEEGAVHTRVKEMLSGAGFDSETLEPVNRKSGYSSVHFVVLVPVKGDDEPQPIEIQVRDIFEEAWGEIDHALRYVRTRDSGPPDDIADSDSWIWMPHLNALKTFADGCSQHASMIKTNAIDLLKRRQVAGNRLPSDKPQATADLLKSALPGSFSGQIDGAFIAQNNATSTLSKHYRKMELRTATDLFAKLIKGTKKYGNNPTSDGRDITFHLNMEYAFCLQPEDLEDEQKIIDIYEAMRKRFPDDPFTYYRQAVVLVERNQPDEAQELVKQGMAKLAADRQIARDAWIRCAMPRLLGYIYWRQGVIAGEVGDNENKLARLREAIEVSRDSVINNENNGEVIKTKNNVVYYMFDYLNGGGKETGDINKASLKELVGELKDVAQPTDPSSINQLHTIMFVRRFLDDVQEAKTAAHTLSVFLYDIAKGNAGNEHLRIDQVAANLDEGHAKIYEDALDVLLDRNCDS